MISSILEKDISNQEKMYRLLSLENEIDNEELCDFSTLTKTLLRLWEQIWNSYPSLLECSIYSQKLENTKHLVCYRLVAHTMSS